MSMVPEYLINIFFDAVKDLNVRFLWRWDKEPPENLPSNVLTRKWFPQQDLLGKLTGCNNSFMPLYST